MRMVLLDLSMQVSAAVCGFSHNGIRPKMNTKIQLWKCRRRKGRVVLAHAASFMSANANSTTSLHLVTNPFTKGTGNEDTDVTTTLASFD